MTTRFAGVFGLLVLAFAIAAAPAHAKPKEAESFLKDKQSSVLKVLKKPANDSRASQLTDVLKDFLDYDDIAEKSLAKEWDKRSVKDRAEFVLLLRQLVERQYQKSLESTLNFRVKYVGAEEVDRGVLVRTSARSTKKKRSPAVEIDYSMRPEEQEWRVFDIATDGVSLVKNYKRQFRRIIRKEGWDGLIGRMKKRLENEGDEF